MDWVEHFHPAIMRLLAGENPYLADTGLFCPPWVLPLLALFWWDPSGQWYMAATALALFPAVWRLSDRDLVATIAFMLSPLTLGMLWYRNLEWMIVVGLALPAPYSIFFVLAKPHLAALTIAWQSRNDRVYRRVALVAALVAAAVLVWGLVGAQRDIARPLSGSWNGATLWPWTIPAGLLIAWLYPTPEGMVAASCFLLPYMAKYSFALATLPLLKRRRWMIACSLSTLAVGGCWLLFARGL
jgi:hypothetical protein